MRKCDLKSYFLNEEYLSKTTEKILLKNVKTIKKVTSALRFFQNVVLKNLFLKKCFIEKLSKNYSFYIILVLKIIKKYIKKEFLKILKSTFAKQRQKWEETKGHVSLTFNPIFAISPESCQSTG